MTWLARLWRLLTARLAAKEPAAAQHPKLRRPREPNTEILRVRARLLDRGQTIADWAHRHGYEPGTARRVIYRWAGRRGVPHGRLTRSILRDLSLDLGIQIPPGIDWAAADAVPQHHQELNPRPPGPITRRTAP